MVSEAQEYKTFSLVADYFGESTMFEYTHALRRSILNTTEEAYYEVLAIDDIKIEPRVAIREVWADTGFIRFEHNE